MSFLITARAPRALLLASVCASAFVSPAAADVAAIRQADTVVVLGERTVAATAQAEAAKQPGNVSVVPAEAFADRYAVTFRDTLQFIPGVIAQPRFGEEVRLSIRGSGVANNAHLRGVELQFDGVPLNGADGFGDFQEIDPTFTAAMSVYRGANAFSLAGATLGGAIAIEGLRARDQETAGAVRIEGGSFETTRANARFAHVGERLDLILAATAQKQRGFRENAEQSNGRFYLQGGWRWTATAETRFGLLINDVNQEIPGALTIAQARTTPQRANAGNLGFAFGRDINSLRAWTRTTLPAGALGALSFGAAYSARDLYHPISIVIDQRVLDHLLFARLEGEAGAWSWSAGARWRDARTAARTFTAIANGQADRGVLTGDSIQRAGGVDVFGELRLQARDDLTLIAGLSSIDTDREVENLRNRAASDSESFSRISPKIGLLWAPREDLQVFANVAGVYEPPAFGQLTQGGFVTFVPIKAQEGVSAEIGARGQWGRLDFEIAYFHARLENEFIAFQVSPLIPAATFNAPNTRRHGLEAGGTARLAKNVFGGALSLRGAWTYSRFRFENDPVYGDNTLAGVPESTLVAELAWEAGPWRIAPSVFTQSDTTVDFRNTLEAPGYTLVNLSASWQAGPNTRLFLEGRNLADEAHVSMVSAIANARAPGVNLAVATPGEGRAFYIGLRTGFGGRP